MKNKCPHCSVRIWGSIYKNHKWKGLPISANKKSGLCSHCEKPLRISDSFKCLLASGFCVFMLGIVLPNILKNSAIDTIVYRSIFLILFIIILIALLIAKVYVKKIHGKC